MFTAKSFPAIHLLKGCSVAESLFYAVLLGAVLGIFFDLLRLPGLILKYRFFVDFFFWIVSAFAVFSYLLIFNSGAVRAVYFVFIFAGFVSVTFTLGYVTRPIHERLAKKIKLRLKSLKKQLQKIYKLLYNKKEKSGLQRQKKIKDGKNGKGRKEEEKVV